MVLENICFLLNNFIRCSAYDHIVFCWVMHEQEILDSILSRLDTEGCAVHCISLICSQEALRARLQKDVDAGIRTEDVMGRSIPRVAQYEKLNTRKIDVTQLSPEDAAERILRYTQAQ